ncbi:hypothetical protein MMC25_002262 [Agyrium rufum]|nr:hypothetical protein [Agyrium rufum]
MGLQDKFKEAVQAVAEIDFEASTSKQDAVPYWDWTNALEGGDQSSLSRAISADIGSLGLEFTRLSQISGDPKFFSAVQRISDIFAAQQDRTALPGLWPVFFDAQLCDFASGTELSIGALADSLYEYLPKMHILLGGLRPEYEQMD